MSYTLQDFRELTRLQLDTDTDDLPDRLVDSWVREGWRFCVNRNRRWPFYRGEWTFASTAGVPAYDESLLVGSVTAPLELDGVLDADGEPLRWVGFEDGQRNFHGRSGVPKFWSLNAGQIRLFPTPESVQTFSAYGWREPAEWVATDNAGATSDLPDVFDDVILEWSLGRAFQRQEDGDLGVMHLDQAEVLLRQLQRRFMKHASSSPMILNDGVHVTSERPVNWSV
jgi:hypothetical protein